MFMERKDNFNEKESMYSGLVLVISALLTGISYLTQSISARGIGGVNYGRVIFPLLVGGIAVYFLKKDKKNS